MKITLFNTLEPRSPKQLEVLFLRIERPIQFTSEIIQYCLREIDQLPPSNSMIQ